MTGGRARKEQKKSLVLAGMGGIHEIANPTLATCTNSSCLSIPCTELAQSCLRIYGLGISRLGERGSRRRRCASTRGTKYSTVACVGGKVDAFLFACPPPASKCCRCEPFASHVATGPTLDLGIFPLPAGEASGLHSPSAAPPSPAGKWGFSFFFLFFFLLPC